MLGTNKALMVGRPRSSGDWTPAALNPAHWYDFSDANTIFVDDGVTKVSTDGELIYRINNKGTANNWFVQSNVSNQLTYKTNQYNGKSAGVSTGGRSMGSYSGIQIVSGIFTAIVVFRISALTCYLFGQYGYTQHLYVAANVQMRWDSAANTTSGAVPTSQANIAVTVYNQANSEFYLNGGTDKQVNNPGSRGWNSNFELFGNGYGSLKPASGSAICEFILMPGVVISGANRILLQNYLSQKWGISIT